MSVVPNPANDFIEANAGGSDSDTYSDGSPEYYQPITAAASGDDEEDVSDHENSDQFSDADSSFHRLPNGYAHGVENGMSSLDLSDDEEREINGEEEEEVRVREAADSAIRRAFREDERRRNAPLEPETATRVMEVMRGVSFSGLAPDWADRVPEDQWIDQLRRLRRTPTTIHD
ncbi:hypothetical protein Acr_15g0001670 [Actinidia rufa]|uniref:Uncharacterized protein n=1 Tax=Actinidia rufa TaxID=165716 RepID=A0A7J0FUG5_9ERIC|nr:hypothetical protein Acr_15g0001670 [Actinidia rufa]